VEAERPVEQLAKVLQVPWALLELIQLDFVLHLVEVVVEELMELVQVLLTENQVGLAEVELLIVGVVEQVWPVKEMTEAINHNQQQMTQQAQAVEVPEQSEQIILPNQQGELEVLEQQVQQIVHFMQVVAQVELGIVELQQWVDQAVVEQEEQIMFLVL
jgi:hypothetical protein